MKRQLFKALAVSGAALVFSACHGPEHREVAVAPSGQVVVAEAPPPAREGVMTAPPAASYTWAPGFWTYHDTRWIWIPGHWQAPPRPGVIWVRGHWDHTARGWVWTPGHWE